MTKRRTDASRAVLRASSKVVRERDGLCFVCNGRGTQIHHRLPRKMGGSSHHYINEPANLLLVCGDCHRDIESSRHKAMGRGLLVPGNRKPDTWPIWHGYTQTWVRHDNDGGRWPLSIEQAFAMQERTDG